MRYILIFIVSIFMLVALCFVPSVRNFIVKYVIEYALSSENIKIRIGSLETNSSRIAAKDTRILVRGQNFSTIQNIGLDYNLDDIIHNKDYTFTFSFFDKATLLGKDAALSAKINYTGSSLSNGRTIVQIDGFSSEVFSDFGIKSLGGYCDINSTHNSTKISDCKITDGTSHLEIDAQITSDSKENLNSLYIKGFANELPLDLHKLFHHLVAHNDATQYVYDNISGAVLRHGSWEINFDQEFFSNFMVKPEHVKAEFDIDNIRLAYDPDFPSLEKIKTKLLITGALLNFKIPSAYSNGTLLSNASVIIDCGVEGDPEVVINSDARGSASDLVNFIPKTQIDELIKSDIDLTKIKGMATSKVYIVVPIGDKPNIYNITSNLSKIDLSIFDGTIALADANLKGIFDGNIVKIEGPGSVNNFSSQISVTQFLESSAEFDTTVTVTAAIAPDNTKHKKSVFYDIKSGSSVLNFLYKAKDKNVQIEAKANLTDLEFAIGKLGIYKNAGDKTSLEVNNSASIDGALNPISIKIYGDNNFKIIGNANITPEKTNISLTKIQSNDTSARADIDVMPHNIKVKLRGLSLDLSRSDMMQFLTKNIDNTASNLDIKLDKIKLKNDIDLTNFIMNIQCDKLRCNKGNMYSQIGTRSFVMNLTSKDDYELWKVTTDNAGAIFKGVGMIDNVKSGNLEMNIETRRRDVLAGQAIPIINGNFVLTKFVTLDNKFLTRLVSFVSLPGLMSAITNNKNISFSNMVGQFSYKDDVVTISDGNAEGPFLDFSMKGNVFTKERKIKIKGQVLPSLYGLSSIINHIPIVSNIFKGKHRKGIFVAPYSLEYKY